MGLPPIARHRQDYRQNLPVPSLFTGHHRFRATSLQRVGGGQGRHALSPEGPIRAPSP